MITDRDTPMSRSCFAATLFCPLICGYLFAYCERIFPRWLLDSEVNARLVVEDVLCSPFREGTFRLRC